MANLTITVDDQLLKQACMRAVEDGTSVNALLRTYLERYAGVGKAGEALDGFAQLALRSTAPAVPAAEPGRATISVTEPIFIDTNVWVYAVDAADPGKRALGTAATRRPQPQNGCTNWTGAPTHRPPGVSRRASTR